MGQPVFPDPHGAVRGMEMGEYAAIHLKVPNSGTPWLDDMIRESRRLDLAAKAMQGIVMVLHQGIRPADIPAMCADAYGIADAMLDEAGKTAAKAEGIAPAADFSKLDALIEKSVAELKPQSDGMLANQRDELLAALKNLCDAVNNEAWRYPTVLDPIVAKAYVVIAKAEGGGS